MNECPHCTSPYCAGCECVNETVAELRAKLTEAKAFIERHLDPLRHAVDERDALQRALDESQAREGALREAIEATLRIFADRRTRERLFPAENVVQVMEQNLQRVVSGTDAARAYRAQVRREALADVIPMMEAMSRGDFGGFSSAEEKRIASLLRTLAGTDEKENG